jgi:hypothetical protein
VDRSIWGYKIGEGVVHLIRREVGNRDNGVRGAEEGQV